MGNREGQQLGNYQLIHLLGRGGFAEVYLGKHIYIETQAAVKVLSAQLVGDNLKRFIREAKIVASLEHPHIVRVLDFGIEGDEEIPFLVMSYAPHGTMRQCYPKESIMPLDEVLSYVQHIAPALQYAHDCKVIHRDVKPENMLLSNQEEILLSDFGIAMITATSISNQAKTTAGTAAYMAPEQISGKPCRASDQYALAVVVYEWLCGQPPFQGSFYEICAQHLHGLIPSLREKQPEIPVEVEQCLIKALAKDPQERFATVQDFAQALQQASQSKIDTCLSIVSQQEPSDFISIQLDAGSETLSHINSDQYDLTDLKDTLEASSLPHPTESDPTFLNNGPTKLLPTDQDYLIVQKTESASSIPFLAKSFSPISSMLLVAGLWQKYRLRSKNDVVIVACVLLLLALTGVTFLNRAWFFVPYHSVLVVPNTPTIPAHRAKTSVEQVSTSMPMQQSIPTQTQQSTFTPTQQSTLTPTQQPTLTPTQRPTSTPIQQVLTPTLTQQPTSTPTQQLAATPTSQTTVGPIPLLSPTPTRVCKLNCPY